MAYFPSTFGPLANYSGINAVNNIKSTLNCKMAKIYSNLKKSQNITYASYQLKRNNRAKARLALTFFVNNISISDMDSIRTQIGMLAMLTSQSDELTRNSSVN